ncbi:MAG: ATP-binding protein [Treponema sp.]|nr:ATP-binding protein [Treponema sp.]
MNNDPNNETNGKKSRFSTKLALGIIAISLVGLVATFLVVHTIVRSTIYDSAVSIAQRDILIQAREIDAWFLKHSKLVEHMATTWMTVGVEPGETGFGPDPIGANFLKQFDSLTGIFVGFENGWHVNSHGWIPDPDFHAATRPWYMVPEAAGGAIAITLPYVRLLDGDIVASMGKWVPYFMGMEAVIAMDIRLGYVFDLTAAFEFSDGGYLILVGPCGEIIVHPNSRYMLSLEHQASNLRDIHNGDFLMDSVNARAMFAEFFDTMFGRSYLITAHLETVGWTLISVVPVAATQSVVNRRIAIIMFALTAVLLALFAFTMFFVSFLTKDMEEKRVALGREQEASRAKSSFLSHMSHEIRTPMNAVIGLAGIAKNVTDPVKKDDCLIKIEKASNHLMGVINQILDMSKIEADKYELNLRPFNFESMTGEIASVLSVQIEGKQLGFATVLDENIPPFIVLDEVRLAQVIINLIGNAIKCTPAGGNITLSAKCTLENTLYVEVADTGIGISQDQQSRLFNAFERVETGDDYKMHGTGLGLAISKLIVEKMGGKIWLDSQLGEGSKFMFTIPFDTTIAEENRDTDEGPQGGLNGDPPNYEKYTLLLAEDIEINQEILIAMLEPTRIKIECAENGAKAVQMFGKTPNRYDIVFMDLQMPQMDGLTATRRIRELDIEKAKSVPIIAMTANVFQDDVDTCLAAGMNGHLGKPLDLVLVLKMLARHLVD